MSNADLTKDLVGFSEKFLTVEGKDATVQQFKMNKAQLYLHNCLEEQIKRQGYVRAIIIKGRQQGCTTYISARFYHKSIFNRGTKVFILSHESKTTDAIFKKVKKYHNNIEQAFKNMAPKLISSNNKQLVFDYDIGSEYTVGTAGNEQVGRGFTVQLLHLSEAAFYEHPEEIEKGLVQAVAGVKNTEVIYETTANGQNFLYTKIREIQKDPSSPYQIIFIPFYWQDEYQVPDEEMPKDFSRDSYTDEEIKLAEKFQLSPNQILWRRRKIQESSVSSFKQEYPFTIEEAFEYSGESLCDVEKVNEARHNNFTINDMMPRVLGVDAARSGDRTIFVLRQGRKVVKWQEYNDMDQIRLKDLILQWIVEEQVDMVFADAAYADAAIDFIRQMGGIGRKVSTIYFNSQASSPDIYLNKRAEIMCAVADWFNEGADIPDSQDFVNDILAIPAFKLSSTHKKQIVSKEEIKKVLGRSTDIMDALALTFAQPVVKDANLNNAALENYNGSSYNASRRGLTRVSKITSLNIKRGIRS